MKTSRFLPLFLALLLSVSLCLSSGAVYFGDITVEEAVTVDGDLSDTGWIRANWIHITGDNGTFQTSTYPYPSFAYDFAVRSDETRFFLGVRLNRPAYLTDGPGQTTSTNLRLWVDAHPSDTERSALFDFSYDGKSCIDTRSTVSCDSVSALRSDGHETCYEISILLSDLGYREEEGLAICVTLSDPFVCNGSYDALHSYVYRNGNDNAPWSTTEGYLRLDIPALRMGVVTVPGYKPSGIYGDLDCDGLCGAYDSILLLQSFAGITEIPEEVLNMADVNGDQKLDLSDATLLLQYQAGMHSAYPVNCTHGVYTVEQNTNGDRTRVCTLCGMRKAFAPALSHVRVGYIPLDDRPVNQERVQYLAQSIGIELVMPEEYLYRTVLDNMEPNPNGLTLGDREALLAWMKEADKTCDYFILSLDQVLSGGLVGSRSLCNTDLSLEYEIMDEVIRLCKNNTVLLFDTVVRLASTVGYNGYDLDTYNAFRSYGQVARKTLSGDELTLENIFAGYRYDADGNEISTRVSQKKLDDYLAARERKMLLADYILRNAGDDMEFLYLGVDDSTPQITIQTNEIAYLTKLLGDRGVLSAAADELGMCCLARLATILYGKVGIHTAYYGPGENQAADSFDIETLGRNVDKHLICMNASHTDTADSGLQALILTRNNTAADRKALLERLEYNLENEIPTVLLDVSGSSAVLGKQFLEQSDLEIGMLVGYSSWNTAGNAMGIALSMGIARYAYLSAVEHTTPNSDAGFLKSMTFAYIKDITYKQCHTNVNGIEDDNYSCSVPLVLRRLNESRILCSLFPYTAEEHKTVTASNFRYPWNRTFEMNFDIFVAE